MFPHLPVHKLRIGANYRMIHAVSKLVKYTKHWVLFVMLLFFSIYRLIYILKRGKPVNIRHTAFMEIKKPIPIVTLVPDVGQQVFCHVLFEVFFSYVCFVYD